MTVLDERPTLRSRPGQSERKVPWKVVAAAVAGIALEFYDFTVYSFFAVFAAKAFFPSHDALTGILASVAVFGVGFATRPIGALFIGRLGDRFGRKPAMLLTIGLIIVGTTGLALTPEYATIGVAAPIIVVVSRLTQGLGMGGEVGPAAAFLMEAAPNGRRGFYLSWSTASQGISSFAAGTAGVTLTSLLSPDDMQKWGWRVAFALGFLLIPVALYLRRQMQETLACGSHGTSAAAAPLRELWQHRRIILPGMAMYAASTTVFYVALYLTTYSIAVLKMPSQMAMLSAIVTGISLIVMGLLGGWLCDRYNSRIILAFSYTVLLLGIYPAYHFLIQAPDVPTLLVATLLMTAMPAMAGPATLTLIGEGLPARVRALGVGLTYAVPIALFGGTAQVVVTWLLKQTGNPAAPAFYAVAASAVMLLAIWAFPKHHDRYSQPKAAALQ
ncbi:MFS transporter [Paraburkholderia sprentiae WSM5005]|uniref:MFS transporter n=2 Tax=Paraburkholderia sprentiae TaxID=948107 RepID=A0A1I9YS45_9BURK|nr:MFS transporter [Paraburkholderia sprentiae WSM5005]